MEYYNPKHYMKKRNSAYTALDQLYFDLFSLLFLLVDVHIRSVVQGCQLFFKVIHSRAHIIYAAGALTSQYKN